MSLLEGDGIPLALLYCVDATFASWACCRVKIPWLINVASTTSATNTSMVVIWTLKQTTQYNKYCIWIVKLGIQIKFNMALLENYQPRIIFESWYYVRRSIFLCYIIISCKFLVAFHPSAFKYLVWVAWIISARSSLHCSLACTTPTPHAIMPRSWKM